MEFSPCDFAALFVRMQLTPSQLAIFEAGYQGLISSQKATYTVDGKRIAADQLAQPLDAGIKSALSNAGAVKGGGGGKGGGKVGGVSVHSRAVVEEGVGSGMTVNPRNRFMYKVRRALF